MPTLLGKTLLIANPAAQNGRGAVAAERAADLLRAALGDDALAVEFTKRPHHAVDLTAAASDYRTVLALGGDGVIHEVANGLMRLAAEARPQFGIVPVGSGNDYARTLGMSTDVDKAVAQLLTAEAHPADVGTVNGHYFVETLSFGLDAAIALDTVERRKRTGRTGTILYAEAGVDQLLHHLFARPYRASFDGGAPVAGESIMFAVQVGPTYGGGFRICPDARIDDGLLDICIAHPPVTIFRAAVIFLAAKFGCHTGFKQIELLRIRKLHVEFDEAPPAQMDGEPIESRSFDVAVEPAALRVLMPQ
ncbi:MULTISPECIES: diacylglycerol/lipid kinase family protein [Gordonibacter]|uniref:Diacylglycerol kinase family lipid kinase n=1 Tax=Gordonibacter faecis TaxID=3047475 RepID=A0ABT7DN34_9ACTN|nr:MULTISPECIES: diacylglycerol kinase family protein [unclassified Gordonibacter]MDJ1650954.1 diacylglycerol kinase family lipid kinase [Gordonibacter sp. KGMB12511]HIW75041.1 diacylglycerol kinase family lipid kinase [Candidatus Gordonibacter avicola]